MKASILSSSSLAGRQRWLAAGLLLFFLLLGLHYVLKVHNSERPNRSAFLRWREQILDLSAGHNIWETFTYPNPPIMALMLEPFAQLPPLLGSLAWFFFKVALTLLALTWVFRLVETPERPFPLWSKALVFLLSLRPIMGDLSHGNINLFILFLVVTALYAHHLRRDVTAGLALALAIAAKVTPALFLPYLVWKRAWKTLASCGAGLVLFFWLVPALFLGADQNHQYLHSWVRHMIVPFVVGGEVTSEHNNQSLPGLVFRLTTHQPSFSAFVEDRYVGLQYHNLITLEPEQARWLVKGCMVLFALLVIWCCRTPTRPRGGWRLAAEYSIVLLGMLLFSERTWKHHCVTLLLPFAVLTYYLAICQPSPKVRYYLIATLAAVVLLMTTTSTGLGDHHEGLGKLAQVYGAYVWAYFLLVAALVFLLRRREKVSLVNSADSL